jgi:hypothetical protein
MSLKLCAGWGPIEQLMCHLTNGLESQTLSRSHRDAVFSKMSQLQILLCRLLFHFIERQVFGLRDPQPVQQNRQLTATAMIARFSAFFPPRA